ncbi:hypothetical protein FKM82_024332 [Ascaphus truei]
MGRQYMLSQCGILHKAFLIRLHWWSVLKHLSHCIGALQSWSMAAPPSGDTGALHAVLNLQALMQRTKRRKAQCYIQYDKNTVKYL